MPTKKQLANLKRSVAAQVAEGFSEWDEIAVGFSENPDEEEFGELDDALIERLVFQAVRAHHVKQAKWATPTDCDKLDAAFKTLERKGIVARQHFTCCSNCGHYEIQDEIKAARKKRKVIGYAFYHMQDTQSAVDGGGIYIKYDATENDEVKKRLIGQKITDALSSSGLKADWNGDPNTAVFVKVKWRKRRSDTLPNGK